MANDVYANGREISCKAADGKSICAFPDVCLSPPSPPAGPVPIPYPNTAFAKDATSGSKSVKVSKKEVMLKNKSYFKKSTGDEAATKSLGMGVVTHQIQGKVYFTSWSPDIKIEGQNVVRHLDLTTHNHASQGPNTPPWPYVDAAALAPGGVCHDAADKIEKACKPEKKWQENCPPRPKDVRKLKERKLASYIRKAKGNDCLKARKCMLVRYGSKSSRRGCCPGQTGHHLVPEESFKEYPQYVARDAPVICAEGPGHSVGTHGQLHAIQSYGMLASEKRSLKYMQKAAAGAVQAVFPESACPKKCIEEQLKKYHEEKAQISPDAELNRVTPQKPKIEAIKALVNGLAK